ncbi:hypothetical protein [Francisella philomiragia]|uniref:hypothetical protein n=1 Tax=Francisella philomiragia TaxID=28110 RepID=UPI001907EE7A|nr:hypothetical protein [Francisella philomiragia]MBK2257566.1 hypothetical protein [Francisella philomiragia]MBK2270272.1 hypothetical protein [Francisella philomiragia]MBK2272118.1 hypothetical protein [Francisella philomiragia]MBK2275957.1 hypothetical protein [Francisella philomiragia]MBK2295458.1 hypothetical protein [Francisella philomiragia]
MTNQRLKFCIGDIYSKQVSIQQEIQKHGFNVVTCQDCGDVILLKKDDEMSITCPHCLNEQDPHECPDLYF